MTETQPTREAMIQRIYEVIATRNISPSGVETIDKVMIGDVLDWIMDKYICLEHGIILKARYDQEEDVYRCMEKHGEHGTSKICESTENIITMWNKLRQPIDNQSDECINYVFSLLPTTEGN